MSQSNRTLPIVLVAAMLVALSVLLAFGQLELLGLAFHALGLSRSATYALVSASMVGSLVNVPLCRISKTRSDYWNQQWPQWDIRWPKGTFTDSTTILLNLGGGLVPVAFALYIVTHRHVPWRDLTAALALVTLISYAFSHVETGLGVVMPAMVAPLAAALAALWLMPENPAPLAYVSGTLGVLLGADVLRLRQATQHDCSAVSIGGAGPLDGIFITGILAVLLSSV